MVIKSTGWCENIENILHLVSNLNIASFMKWKGSRCLRRRKSRDSRQYLNCHVFGSRKSPAAGNPYLWRKVGGLSGVDNAGRVWKIGLGVPFFCFFRRNGRAVECCLLKIDVFASVVVWVKAVGGKEVCLEIRRYGRQHGGRQRPEKSIGACHYSDSWGRQLYEICFKTRPYLSALQRNFFWMLQMLQ